MQPHPTASRSDVERIVRRDFPAEWFHEVMATLDEYGTEDWQLELGPAEYPGYTKKMFRIDKLPEEERLRIIDADWKQYQAWFNG